MKTTATAVLALVLAGTAQAKLPRHHDPVTYTEHGASMLLWLHNHTRAGTTTSRARLRRDAHWLIRDGLRRAGVLPGLFCVHGHEAPWHGDDNPKYDGGLQMNGSFQWSYGRRFVFAWGTADHWPIWAQLVAAYRAIRVRRWGPWPNTAAACGLR